MTLQDSDQQLWQRVRQGDANAFRELYDRHSTDLFAFLSSRCRGRLDASDCAQAVWLKVWEARKGNFDGRHCRGWLFEVARNHLHDRLRVEMRERRVFASQSAAFEQAPDPVVRDNVEESPQAVSFAECLEQVGGDFVAVLRARLNGTSTGDIARQLQISEAAVYTRVHRGKEELRSCVEEKLR